MKKAGLILAGLLLLGACGTSHNVRNTVDATNFNFMSAKKGEDCKYALFGILPFSKTDIDKAAKKANIHSLGFVEYSFKSYILVTKECVVVYGK